MDPQNRAVHMREQLKQIYRSRLPNLGWCDDNVRRKEQVELAYGQVRGDWEAEAATYQSVVIAALEASSTDNEHQTVDMTLSNDRSFWSSTGHASQVAHEALLYELSGPACQVASIKLAPYRALYQDGYPVYPPMRLQVWMGSNPYNLQPASPWHDVLPSDALQTFALWPHAPVGRYLQIRMYGKLQKQREDTQFYVAIRHVDASGTPLSVPELLALQPLLRSNSLQLAGPTPSLPATIASALQAAADYGVGPEQLQGAPGGGRVQLARAGAAFTQQDGQPKLALRPRALRQLEQGGAGLTPQQEQHEQEQEHRQGSAMQRVTAGIKSILGRRGAAAAAVVSSGEAGPSKRPQQQEQQPQSPPPAPPLLPQQQWQQQLRQGPPLWLADEAAGGLPSQQPQQQEQPSGQHHDRGGVQALRRPEDSTARQSFDSNPEAGEAEGSDLYDDAASDGTASSASAGVEDEDMHRGAAAAAQQQGQHLEGSEDEGMGAAGAQVVQQQAGADAGPAAAAEMDGAAWVAAQRLHQQIALSLQNVPPWQQEQVLAELLADEPTGGRAGRGAFREHLQHLQQVLQQQNQGQNPAQMLPAPHPPPLLAILPGSSDSNSSGSSSGGWSEVVSPQDAQGLGLRAVKARAVLDQQLVTARWFYVNSMIEAIAGVDEDEQRLRQRYAAAYHAAAAEAGAVGAAAAGTSSERPAQGLGSSPGASDTATGAAPPFLAATRLFEWQELGVMATSGSSSSSLHEQHQQQWCRPASFFCEGLEADLWAAC